VERNEQDFMGSATSEGHKNAPKMAACQIDRPFAAVLGTLPLSAGLKIKFCLRASNRKNTKLKFLLRKENVP
jgi:hypothetical protein